MTFLIHFISLLLAVGVALVGMAFYSLYRSGWRG